MASGLGGEKRGVSEGRGGERGVRREEGDGFEINRRRKRECFLTYVYSILTKYV